MESREKSSSEDNSSLAAGERAVLEVMQELVSEWKLPADRLQQTKDILKKFSNARLAEESKKKLMHAKIKDTPNRLPPEIEKKFELDLKTQLTAVNVPEDKQGLIVNTLKQTLNFVLANKGEYSKIVHYTKSYIDEAFATLSDPKIINQISPDLRILKELFDDDFAKEVEKTREKPQIMLVMGDVNIIDSDSFAKLRKELLEVKQRGDVPVIFSVDDYQDQVIPLPGKSNLQLSSIVASSMKKIIGAKESIPHKEDLIVQPQSEKLSMGS
jgi:hypothetical protein